MSFRLFLKNANKHRRCIESCGNQVEFSFFRPGLVGGHCIGVDPYYLTHKAQKLGFQSKMILAGRETNERMPDHVVNLLQKK